MSQVFNSAMRYANQLGTWEWFGIMIGILVVGFYCMRGFGRQ